MRTATLRHASLLESTRVLDGGEASGFNHAMPTGQDSYADLIASLKKTALLASVAGVLHWDERTQLPPKGGPVRAEQLAMLAAMVHERFTSPQIGDLLATAEASDVAREPDAQANLREIRRQYDRATKLPGSLVEALTRAEVLGQQAWVKAKQTSDYASFAPFLQRNIELVKEKARCLLPPGRPPSAETLYDALLEDYEPGETAANLRSVFATLRQPLVDLVGRIVNSGKVAPVEILMRHYPRDPQARISREAAIAIGYDIDAGRIDVAEHPFSTGIAPGDTRITTRYDEQFFGDGFFSTLHETGHAMYNQGLPAEHFGTPLGDDAGLGIHESQSRMWENLVGRSRAFWRFFFPRVREAFPEATAGVSEDEWHFAINDVRPSLIRTESDELTYNLHIMLRFELELALLGGEVSVEDLPGVWRDRMREYLGVEPATDREGVLQDVHWSAGAIGYFPTYTLGNLYAAQFFEQAQRDVGDFDSACAGGDFTPLLGWLRQKIHWQGRRYYAAELVQRVTGRPLSAEPLLAHLRRKTSELYGV